MSSVFGVSIQGSGMMLACRTENPSCGPDVLHVKVSGFVNRVHVY